MKKIILLAVISCLSYSVFAQSEYMVVTKKNGSSVNIKVADVDSVSFATLVGEPQGSYTESGISIKNYDMEINPISKLPYVFYYVTGKAGSLASVNNGVWSNVGALGFTPSVPYDASSLSFDENGVPYVFFINAGKYGQVMKYANNAWTNVGNQFGTTSTITGMVDGIALDQSSNPIVGYMLSSAVGSIAKRTLVVNYFDGDAWMDNLTISGVAATDYLVTVFKAGSTVYCSFIQQGVGGSYKLYKYEGNFTWSKVCDFLPSSATQPNIAGVDWAVSNDGSTVYLLAGSDAITNSVWFPTVYKYNVSTTTWTQVGDPLPSAGGTNNATMQSACRFALNIDSKGNPMVFYKNYDNHYYPTIVTLNADTRQWNTPVVLDKYPLGTGKIMLKSVESGVQYASYIKAVDGINQVALVKLNY